MIGNLAQNSFSSAPVFGRASSYVPKEEDGIFTPFAPLRMGRLGRLADNAPANSGVLPAGTQLRLTGNIYTLGIPQIVVPQFVLDAIAANLRTDAYDIIRYNASYSAISFDITLKVDKNDFSAQFNPLTDFKASVDNALAAQETGDDATVENINYSFIYDPRTSAGQQVTNVVPPGTVTSPGTDKDNPSNKPPAHTHTATAWDDGTKYEIGVYSLDKFLGSSFFGGAISGGIIAGLGVLGLGYALFIKK